MAALRRRSRPVARRLGWGVADQAMSSLTNFAVSILVVRTLGAAQFGAYSLAYVSYGFALNASRGLATDPLLVRFSGTDLGTWRRAAANCTGTGVVVGVAMGICVLGAGALLQGTTGAALLALGLTLPGLLLQDSWRYSFFALGRGGQAFLNDTIWGVTLIPTLLLLRATSHKTVFWFVLAWGAAAAVAAAAGSLQARVVPRPWGVQRWVTDHRDLGPRYVAEGTSHSAAGQLRTYGFGILLGLAGLGYISAANTLMGPLVVLFAGMNLVTIPEAARVLRRSPRHLPLFCLLISSGLAALVLGWGVILLVAMPRGLGAAALGPAWRPVYPLVLPIVVGYTGGALAIGAGTGLHALGASRRSLRAMLIVSAVSVAFGLAGAAEGGVVGAVRYGAIADWVGLPVTWWEFRAALHDSDVQADYRHWLFRLTGRHRQANGQLRHRGKPQTHEPGKNENT